MSKHLCLYGILLLFFASFSLQYFRIKMRKRIVEAAEEFIVGTLFEDDWKKSGEGLSAILKDFKRIRIVKKSSSQLPTGLLHRLQNFRVLCTVEQVTTISTLIAVVLAYRVCVL